MNLHVFTPIKCYHNWNSINRYVKFKFIKFRYENTTEYDSYDIKYVRISKRRNLDHQNPQWWDPSKTYRVNYLPFKFLLFNKHNNVFKHYDIWAFKFVSNWLVRSWFYWLAFCHLIVVMKLLLICTWSKATSLISHRK